jgi:invasion protein IalB
MNSSLDRSNRFRSLVGSALLAAFALTLGTALAIAQEGQPVPKTTVPKATVPKAAPAAPAAAAPAGAPAAGAEGSPEDSAWVKLCLKNEQTGNKQICLVNHEGLEPNTGMVLVAAAVRTIEGEDKQNLLVRLPTAYSLIIPAGVQIKIDDGEPISLQYAVCFPTSCQVQMELTKETFDKMRKGKQMVVAAMNMQQKTMAFPVPLTGFSKTFDGPPVDNAKYEEARRQMMEKFRQRQMELANKAAEAEQKKGQAGGGAQAGGAPAPAPAPNAMIAPPKMPATPSPQ